MFIHIQFIHIFLSTVKIMLIKKITHFSIKIITVHTFKMIHQRKIIIYSRLLLINLFYRSKFLFILFYRNRTVQKSIKIIFLTKQRKNKKDKKWTKNLFSLASFKVINCFLFPKPKFTLPDFYSKVRRKNKFYKYFVLFWIEKMYYLSPQHSARIFP